MRVLAFDTSNYTTSVACFDGREGHNISRLLDVAPGTLGLRQSDALFHHVKRLPELADRLFSDFGQDRICAVGASTRPRAVDGSYMPCFLAGQSQAEVMAAALGVPFYAFSHQQGHIAASLFSSDHMELMDEPHLAWHLSGGTTEFLLVTPQNNGFLIERIGGTSDISAGQLIDRTGQKLALAFPAGKAMDALAQTSDVKDSFPVRVNDFSFSLSGMENKVQQMIERGVPAENVARFVLLTVSGAVKKTTRSAQEQYGKLPVVFSGGVSSNSLLRACMSDMDAVFAPPAYSADNAYGCAVLAARLHTEEGLV